MFETALVESSNALKSRSKYWMFVTCALNLAVVVALVLIPLLNPAALPRTALNAVLTVPPPPPPPVPRPAAALHQTRTVAPLDARIAPSRVPATVATAKEPPPSAPNSVMSGSTYAARGDTEAGVFNALGLGTAPVVVAKQVEKPIRTEPMRVSGGVAAGALLTKTTPVYPALAKAAHVSGSVSLHAVISTTGTIESLEVVSGPEMLRGSALDAVRQWRYRPYLLNGVPTTVETTITVHFSFAG